MITDAKNGNIETIKPEPVELKPGTSAMFGDVRVSDQDGKIMIEQVQPEEVTPTLVEKDAKIKPEVSKYLVVKGVKVQFEETPLGMISTCQDDGGKLYEFFAPEVIADGD